MFNPNQPNIVHKLRQTGFKVRVMHTRNCLVKASVAGVELKAVAPFSKKEAIKNKFEILSKGGSTTIDLTTPDGFTYHGVANVNLKDNFNRLTGIRIALGRILSQIEQKIIV